jgi:hypothetical protein
LIARCKKTLKQIEARIAALKNGSSGDNGGSDDNGGRSDRAGKKQKTKKR